ncbi:MAG TPA: flagellin [Oligoflexia bacterium]|nr:flagellin [Oligoflexia bacterium]
MSRITINSNQLALNAHRRLGDSSTVLLKSFQRLSSGLRINRASDDAAGLSVSSLLDTDRKVFNQGIRNINDGISYLNVAEGAMNELSNVVTRIQELAEQSANGTLGAAQRNALQQEVNALQDEYNRIIRSTRFNGNQLLTGLSTNTILQGGYGQAAQLATQIGGASIGLESDQTRAGLTTRIDTASDGTPGNDTSLVSAISADGRFVAFSSGSSNLVAGDSNGQSDAFIKDMLTGETRRVSTDSSGNQANGQSIVTAISADGRFVTFSSTATNLVAGYTNGAQDVFIKDMQTGETKRVSTDSSGNQSNGQSFVSYVSADGRFVTFSSTATNLVAGDTNGSIDVFIKDIQTGETRRVSTDSSGNQANSTSLVTGISADGRFVAFNSFATNLVAGDTNGAQDGFIKDMLTGEVRRVTTDSSGTQANAQSSIGAISADGRYVVFDSVATNLVAGDTNGWSDVFIKDLVTGETRRISTDSSGNQANGQSFATAISADGRYVTFNSAATNLVAGDTNGIADGFVKDLLTGETRIVSTDSLGIQAGDSTQVTAISADGRYATFYNAESGESFFRDLSKAGVNEISGMVVSDQASARVSLDLAKRYKDELSLYKAGVGASLSRAMTFLSTLQTSSENYALASSQIRDVDVAEESSQLVRSKILQQAASAVLAQANFQPEIALKLLKGTQ